MFPVENISILKISLTFGNFYISFRFKPSRVGNLHNTCGPQMTEYNVLKHCPRDNFGATLHFVCITENFSTASEFLLYKLNGQYDLVG